MNKTNKYKVTLEFEVAVHPVIVPDINTFEKMSSQKEDGGAGDLKLREALKKKGLADHEIEKYLAESKKNEGAKEKEKPTDYQMLLYPEYEKWANAQRSLQVKILEDDEFSRCYIREIMRDLTEGQIEAMVNEKYGAPDLSKVLKNAMKKIPKEYQQLLKMEEDSLRLDETELLDGSVRCSFNKLDVHAIS